MTRNSDGQTERQMDGQTDGQTDIIIANGVPHYVARQKLSDRSEASVGLLPKIMPMLIRGQQEWI